MISNIVFASYGSPSGDCYAFEEGSCHNPDTKEIIEDLCLGETECTLSATGLVFGDPCPVVSKNLRVQAECTGIHTFKN